MQEDLTLTLSRLELELLQPGTRTNAVCLGELLHPDFEEVGRSGHVYSRDEVLQALPSEALAGTIQASAFAATLLSPGVVLLRFRTVLEQPDGTRTKHSLRSSIWLLNQGRWQLRYHQGTAANDVE